MKGTPSIVVGSTSDGSQPACLVANDGTGPPVAALVAFRRLVGSQRSLPCSGRLWRRAGPYVGVPVPQGQWRRTTPDSNSPRETERTLFAAAIAITGAAVPS